MVDSTQPDKNLMGLFFHFSKFHGSLANLTEKVHSKAHFFIHGMVCMVVISSVQIRVIFFILGKIENITRKKNKIETFFKSLY